MSLRDLPISPAARGEVEGVRCGQRGTTGSRIGACGCARMSPSSRQVPRRHVARPGVQVPACRGHAGVTEVESPSPSAKPAAVVCAPSPVAVVRRRQLGRDHPKRNAPRPEIVGQIDGRLLGRHGDQRAIDAKLEPDGHVAAGVRALLVEVPHDADVRDSPCPARGASSARAEIPAENRTLPTPPRSCAQCMGHHFVHRSAPAGTPTPDRALTSPPCRGRIWHMGRVIWLIVGVLCLGACNRPAPAQGPYAPGQPPGVYAPPNVGAPPGSPPPMAVSARVIRADAPEGLNLQHLGMPLDANFQPMVGAGATTLFPQSGPPLRTDLNEMQHDQDLVRSVEQLSANAHAWMIDASASYASQRRQGYYRALQIASVYELRDNTPMRQPPPGAVYYPWRIYMGHSFSEVVEGDSATFNASVGAEFLTVGGAISAFTGKYHLTSHFAGRGLRPTSGNSIFARTSQEVAANYSAFGPEAPIIVEYRQIPNTRTNDGAIAWTAPTNIEVRYVQLNVSRAGSWWYNYSNWSMFTTCFVNGQQQGPQQQFFGNRISNGGQAGLPFSQRFSLNESDVVECKVSGTYTRANSSLSLGTSTTGTIPAGTVRGATTHVMQPGQDSNTTYTITWMVTRLP